MTVIPIAEAIEHVGVALYREDWIGQLTPCEEALIERIDRIWTPRADAALVNASERAREHQEAMEVQYRAVEIWLQDRGFDSEAESLDAAAFERAFMAAFGTAPGAKPSATAPAGGGTKAKRKTGPAPLLRKRIADKMLDALVSGRTPAALAKDTLAALATEFGGSPNTAKGARSDALARFSELQKIRTLNNSEH